MGKRLYAKLEGGGREALDGYPCQPRLKVKVYVPRLNVLEAIMYGIVGEDGVGIGREFLD